MAQNAWQAFVYANGLIKHKDSCLYMKRFDVTVLCYWAQTGENGRQWIVM